jgi:hypothetical protein
MKITLVAILFVVLIASPTALFQTLAVAQANYATPPSIEISSPVPLPDAHSSMPIPLNIRINILTNEPDITSISYSLDGNEKVIFTNLKKEDNQWYWTDIEDVFVQGKAFSVQASLGNLSEGKHSLMVYAYYADDREMSRSREFAVNTSSMPVVPSELQFLSPLNRTYATSVLPLTFAVNGTIDAVNYVLDNQEEVFIHSMENTTLTALSEGMQKLTAAVWTHKGFVSQSVFFSVAIKPDTQQHPLQTWVFIVILGCV